MPKKNSVSSTILSSPKFVDDLPAKTFEKGTKYAEVLSKFNKQSKKWALIATFDKSGTANGAAGYLRKYPALLPGKFEFSVRTEGNGAGLYARRVG